LSKIESATGFIDNDESGRHKSIDAADHEAVDEKLQKKRDVHSGYSA
jgi:hypothetical protein